MRTTVVTLGLSLIIPVAVAAQASSPQVTAPPQERLTVTPAIPNLDFGLEQAKRKLPVGPWRLVTPKPGHELPMQPSLPAVLQSGIPQAMDCAMVKKHNHGPLALTVIPPPREIGHQLKTVAVTPCPVR